MYFSTLINILPTYCMYKEYIVVLSFFINEQICLFYFIVLLIIFLHRFVCDILYVSSISSCYVFPEVG